VPLRGIFGPFGRCQEMEECVDGVAAEEAAVEL